MDSLPFESYSIRPDQAPVLNLSASEPFITDSTVTNEHVIKAHQDSDIPIVTKDDDTFHDAVATLMWRDGNEGRSLFDHIAAIIRRVHQEKGKGDLWNNDLKVLSRLVKRCNVPPLSAQYIKPGYIPDSQLEVFLKRRQLFDDDASRRGDHGTIAHQGIGYTPPDPPLDNFPPLDDVIPQASGEDGEESQPVAVYKPIDIYQWMFYAQEGAISLASTETYLVMNAILKFQKAYYPDLARLRFWGKILATKNDYYILEVEFKENSDKWFEKSIKLHREKVQQPLKTNYDQFPKTGFEEDYNPKKFTLDLAKFPVPPEPAVDPDQFFKDIPTEEAKAGANMYCYYVCTDLIAAEWMRLPDVTPDQIRKARFIRKGFTGDLEAPIISCPSFPGVEKNYLRAQIARITHGTVVGPIGQYVAPEEEEEPAEDGTTTRFQLTEDPEFEHPPLRDVLSKNLAGYGHNLPFLLKQGRCTFFDPTPRKPKGDGEDEEEEEEPEEEPEEEGEEGAEKNKIVKKKIKAKIETAPPIFSPISEDKEAGKEVPAWVVRVTNNVLPQNGVVKICSNLWPGAMCICQSKQSENFYVGNGLKYTDNGPFNPPPPQQCFNAAMKLLQHASDPPVAAEEERRKKLEAAEKAKQEAAEIAAAEKEGEETEAEGEGDGEEEEDEEGK